MCGLEVARKTILVVEDDYDLRDVVCDVLRDLGYVVLCAGDGREALAVLQARQRVDLILLDLMMPGMNGYQFRDRQLADAALAPIPVVVFTAGNEQRCNALGNVVYLRKPVELDDLVQTVRRFV